MKPQNSSNQPTRSQAILVGLDFHDAFFDERLAEAVELVNTAGAGVAETIVGKRAKPDAASFAGSGKLEEIAAAVLAHDANLVVFNHALSPIQIRNVEKHVGVRVIDRTDLILDIFGQRARSAEGRLQVELAQMQHLLTRLVKGWTHLERQRGGIGVRGGPGETQLEIDRRLVSDKIRRLKEKLKRLDRQRGTQRSSRKRAGVYKVSIVGYTNAGKSTLFNRMTRASAYVADQLFATLDTTTRKVYIEPGIHATLSDTVGFIRDLPHGLIAAFHATLTEAIEADLILHVVDAASPMREQHIEDVNAVLAEIGAAGVPLVIVYNKIDRLDASPVAALLRNEDGNIAELRVSAMAGLGMDLIRKAIRQHAERLADSTAIANRQLHDLPSELDAANALHILVKSSDIASQESINLESRSNLNAVI